MQRASHVRVDQFQHEPSPGKMKTPPAATGGAVTQEASRKENADGFARAFCFVAQARYQVKAIIVYADSMAHAGGMNPDARSEIEHSYRAAWGIYRGCFPSYVRTLFPDLMGGVAFEEFETAMECVGQHLFEGRPRRALDSYLLPPDEVCDE